MGVMSMPKTTLPKLSKVVKDFEQLHFKSAKEFYWSARDRCIYYNEELATTEAGFYQLLHEIGHALSGHHHYESGVELVKMEAEAWQQATEIAKQYGLNVPTEKIERCLDSYRDWLHLRSSCPDCGSVAVEIETNSYQCFNCLQKWTVPIDQRTRRYRLKMSRS